MAKVVQRPEVESDPAEKMTGIEPETKRAGVSRGVAVALSVLCVAIPVTWGVFVYPLYDAWRDDWLHGVWNPSADRRMEPVLVLACTLVLGVVAIVLAVINLRATGRTDKEREPRTPQRAKGGRRAWARGILWMSVMALLLGVMVNAYLLLRDFWTHFSL